MHDFQSGFAAGSCQSIRFKLPPVPSKRLRTFRQSFDTSLVIVAWMCVVEFADVLLRQQKALTLDGLGILPRTVPGLIGILLSPLLHANFAHLAANALPLLILLTILFWDAHYRPWQTLGSIWILSGLGTWLIGRSGSIHIGASSIIFGLVAHMIVAGLFMRSWRSAFTAILVFLAFGGIFYGVLPHDGPISWEAHLCGALAGLVVAWSNRK
jgi:membrane associated rhomboid family serine protease